MVSVGTQCPAFHPPPSVLVKNESLYQDLSAFIANRVEIDTTSDMTDFSPSMDIILPTQAHGQLMRKWDEVFSVMQAEGMDQRFTWFFGIGYDVFDSVINKEGIELGRGTTYCINLS
jgi:hypothetical protein